ncbi:MAG: tyrosine-type recombinase/integrase [Bacteriovoracia bacterium]
MAIIKRYRKTKGQVYQVKVKGSDGRWITDTFETRAEAEKREAELVLEKRSGGFVTNLSRQLSVAEYFTTWAKENISSDASLGWKKSQHQMFQSYVQPVIGQAKLQQLNPGMVARVLNRVAEMGRGPATRLHVYGLMHKMFGDAVELYDLLPRNPVIRKLRPKVPQKESPYLEMDEVIKLLRFVEGKSYRIAIWLQLLAGLRVGEVQYLKWEHVDLKNGVIHVRGTFRRKEGQFYDLPKGKKWHRVKMPPELWEVLRQERQGSQSEFVVLSPTQPVLNYYGYVYALRSYCKQLGIRRIGTHGLRHSTAEIYMNHGASRGDLRMLFAHSTDQMTDRYVHDKGRRLDEVADNVYLFRPRVQTRNEEQNEPVSLKFPHSEKIRK